MRNIALLEWGPASLFYIQPRELIKVRTKFLDGGPVLPPFLTTMEEAKAHDPDLTVRYALSAFEDLNSAIKNLRRCFGFPYQEYIGPAARSIFFGGSSSVLCATLRYMNTLTHQYRTRSEHEGLIDRIRRWAMFGNVDAVLWIDYAKANQPPGSFKMGPRESRPFGPAHLQICADMPEVLRLDDNDESEAAWSEEEKEEEKHGHSTDGGQAGMAIVPREPGSLRPLPKRIPRNIHRMRPSHMLMQAVSRATSPPDKEEAMVSAKIADDGFNSPVEDKITLKAKAERDMLRLQLQEEVVPVPGSIYSRSIVPGPGYYRVPKAFGEARKDTAPSLSGKGTSAWDQLRLKAQWLPGPGQYENQPGMTDEKLHKRKKGSFNKAPKLVQHQEAFKKLPFISELASSCEGFGLSSDSFHCVDPQDCQLPHHMKEPAYSFGRTRRPF
eukprot:symbB.v1.2.010133.t1/scaffold618.1/size180184/10